MPTGEMVVVDASIVEGCRLRRAVYSHNEMAGEDQLGLAFETYKKIQAGQPIRIGTARKVMEALGFRCLEDILSPESREEYQEKLGQMPAAAPEALSFVTLRKWVVFALGKIDRLGEPLCSRCDEFKPFAILAFGKERGGLQGEAEMHHGHRNPRHEAACERIEDVL